MAITATAAKAIAKEFGVKVVGYLALLLRNKWVSDLRKKGKYKNTAAKIALIVLLPLCSGCSDGFKLWYVNTYDALTGYTEPVAVEDYTAEQEMITAEPRLSHLVIPADMPPTITVQAHSAGGLNFQTKTFGSGRNDLDQNYETLVLTRFTDGQQKAFGTSWPAADSRAFRDDTHNYNNVDRFMVVLNRGRVNKDGRVIGKAQLVEYSEVVKL